MAEDKAQQLELVIKQLRKSKKTWITVKYSAFSATAIQLCGNKWREGVKRLKTPIVKHDYPSRGVGASN